jgi:hypothetical protein
MISSIIFYELIFAVGFIFLQMELELDQLIEGYLFGHPIITGSDLKLLYFVH